MDGWMVLAIALVVGVFAWLGVPLLLHRWQQRNRRSGEPCATCEKPLRRDGFCRNCDQSDFTLNSSLNDKHMRGGGQVWRNPGR